MFKLVLSFLLGLLAIGVEFGVGEGSGSLVAAVLSGALFVFLVQLKLARGESEALRRGWWRAPLAAAPSAILALLAWRAHEPRVQVLGGLAAAALMLLGTLLALWLEDRRARR
jgi:hypothetical protein